MIKSIGALLVFLTLLASAGVVQSASITPQQATEVVLMAKEWLEQPKLRVLRLELGSNYICDEFHSSLKYCRFKSSESDQWPAIEIHTIVFPTRQDRLTRLIVNSIQMACDSTNEFETRLVTGLTPEVRWGELAFARSGDNVSGNPPHKERIYMQTDPLKGGVYRLSFLHSESKSKPGACLSQAILQTY